MPVRRPFKAEDLYALQFVEDPHISPDGEQIAFVKLSLDKLGNKYVRHVWLAALDGAKARTRQFTFGAKSATTPRWRPDGKALAFVAARDSQPQIYLISLEGGEARPLTSMPNGATNPVWSPDGRKIAFLSPVNAEERRREDTGKADPSPASALEARHRDEMKEDKEKQKADPRVITRLPYRTGTEYMGDRFSHIYVTEVGASDEAEPGKPYRLTEGEMNFNEIAWSKDGAVIISAQSRTPEDFPWEHESLVRLPAAGKRRPFRYITAPGYEYFAPQVSPDGKWIAALRVLDSGSFGHRLDLAVMPAGGGEARALTADLDRSVEAFHWSADSRALYFQAEDHGDVGVYRVSVRGGGMEKVVGGRRTVLGFSVDRAGRIAFAACTPERPVDLYIAKADGQSEKRLTAFNDQLLAEREVARTEAMHYTAADGCEIQGWMVKPIGFRKGKKYPLAVNMHGGPHVMWGPGHPSMWLEWQLHAARGYVVFYCNPRGSEGYGEAHTTAIQNNWGEVAMQDVLAGVDKVVSLGFVDPKRLALTGGSYAGYLTAWIVGHDQRFACAWAQRGLYNLMSWYGATDVPWLIEREFEIYPFDDYQKAWQHSPLAYVRDIHTPLAIEHQDQDWRCPPADAEQLFTALKRLKRTVVFYRYPREGHEMSRSGEPQHRVDRLNRMVAWFDRYCMKRR